MIALYMFGFMAYYGLGFGVAFIINGRIDNDDIWMSLIWPIPVIASLLVWAFKKVEGTLDKGKHK